MKQLITHMREIPEYALKSLNESEYHIFTGLFERGLYIHCHFSLEGFKIEPKNFEYDIPLTADMYRRKDQVDVTKARSFDKALRNFAGTIHSRETKHGTIYLKSTARKDNYATETLQSIKDSYLVFIVKDSRIDKINDQQAKEIFEDHEKRMKHIVGHAIKTTKVF